MKRAWINGGGMRRLLMAACAVVALAGTDGRAAEKMTAQLSVRDVLVLPGQPARIEAILTTRSLLGTPLGLGGEQLELVIGGKAVAKAMTGGDGRGYFEYTPPLRGNHEMTVRLAPNPRVSSSPGKAVLAAWERRRPILLVEVAALKQPDGAVPLPVPSMPIPLSGEEDPPPVPDAAAELSRLTQFFYNVMYVSWSPQDQSGSIMGDGEDVREWLARHKFPRGLSVLVDPGKRSLGEKIDDLGVKGWKNVKAGIGRSVAFADVLVEHRMDVVIVPEPDRGELPRKAKTVKTWKEVRTKL